MTDELKIDLSRVERDDGIKFLNDQGRGEEDSTRLGVKEVFDCANKADRDVLVIVPDDLYGVSTSYVNGLFSSTIRALGIDGVMNRLVFDAPDHIVMSIVTSLRIWKSAAELVEEDKSLEDSGV